MRDHAKDEEYFNQRYSADSKYLEKWMDSYQEKISNPEKYNVESYKYSLFIYSFYKFYSGYSLGLDINELLPDIKLIIQNLIETRKEEDTNYEDMEYILHFIILFNQIEYLEEYKKLIEKSEDRDFYFDLLMQYLDSSWEISTEKILWPKDMKPLVEVIQLSKTDKTLAVQRLKKYLEKEWFKTLKEGLITNKQLEKGRYRGYWCKEYGLKESYKTSTTGNRSFMQAHHGIQSFWAENKLKGYYDADKAPALLLRDSFKGTPHEFITNTQKHRDKNVSYFRERANLERDLRSLNVDEKVKQEYLKLVDDYFHSIYKQMQKDNVKDIDKIFDFDFTTHTQLSKGR